MKIFAFFLAVLVLALSVMPCADGASATQEGKATFVISKSDTGHSETGDDDCSPFCQCSCCASFSINHRHTPIDFSATYSVSHFTVFNSPKVGGIPLPIWQPPQLV